MIAEDAGEEIVARVLRIAAEMGFGYLSATEDVGSLHAGGLELASGTSLEAEIALVLPD